MKGFVPKICIGILTILCLSCQKLDEIGPQREDDGNAFVPAKNIRLLIGCEGNFQFGNASLHEYNLESGELARNVYQSVNEASVGDVLQSMTLMGDTIALVVNNSGKVIFMDAKSYRVVAEMDGFVSPRYLVPTGTGKVLVTDLYANEVTIIDLKTLKKEKVLPVFGWTERMVATEHEIFIADLELPGFYRYDVMEMTITDTVHTSFVPQTMAVVNGDIIVAGPKKFNGAHSQIAHFSMDEMTETRKTDFQEEIRQVQYDSISGSLFVLADNLYKTDLKQTAWHKVLAANGTGHFYRFVLSADASRVFITDAVDYIQNGHLIDLHFESNDSSRMEIGVAPGSLLLLP